MKRYIDQQLIPIPFFVPTDMSSTHSTLQLMVQDFWENDVVEPKPALLIDGHPEVPDLNSMLFMEYRQSAAAYTICLNSLCRHWRFLYFPYRPPSEEG